MEMVGERLSFRALYRLSPVGVAGAICAGFTNSSLIGLGPVFAARLDIPVTQISLLMTAPSTSVGLARDGKVRVLGVTGDKRLMALPEVPTLWPFANCPPSA